MNINIEHTVINSALFLILQSIDFKHTHVKKQAKKITRTIQKEIAIVRQQYIKADKGLEFVDLVSVAQNAIGKADKDMKLESGDKLEIIANPATILLLFKTRYPDLLDITKIDEQLFAEFIYLAGTTQNVFKTHMFINRLVPNLRDGIDTFKKTKCTICDD